MLTLVGQAWKNQFFNKAADLRINACMYTSFSWVWSDPLPHVWYITKLSDLFYPSLSSRELDTEIVSYQQLLTD